MKTTKILLGAIRVSALLALFAVVPLSAQTLLYTDPSLIQPFGTQTRPIGNGGGGITVGFQFTLTSSIEVTELGLWDQDGAPLTISHEIGLWSSTGTLLDSATVGSGTSGTLVDGEFRFVAATPLTLAAGTYDLGEGSADTFIDFSNSGNASGVIPFVSAVSTSSAAYTSSAPFGFPGGPVGGNGYVGPNLEFTAVSAPEPSSLATLSLVGMASLLGYKRFKKQSV